MRESPVGLRCPGDLTHQERRVVAQGAQVEHKPSGKRGWRRYGEMSDSNSETLAGHQGRGSQNSSGSSQRTGVAFTSTKNEGPK